MAKLLKDIIQDKVESSIFDPNKIIADFIALTGYKLKYNGDQGFEFNGSLDLNGTKITELPDNLMVRGHVDLYGTWITELPDNLAVGGYLDIRKTNITEVPDNLTVGGDLYMRGTKIKSLPNNLNVRGDVFKDF